MASSERLQIPDAEFARSAMILARRFVQRWDLYAVQLDDGRYVCVREPLNAAHLYAHLRGELTLGSYVLNPKSSARYIVFDADDRRQFADLVDLTRTLGNSLPSYLETSRRGGHLWLFFDHPIPGRDARAFGKGLLDRYRINDLELFPKQDRLGKGPGSLIRMPFGIHRLDGRRYHFVAHDGSPLAPTIRQQIQLFSTPQTVPTAAFETYEPHDPPTPAPVDFAPSDEPTGTLSEQIKASMSVLEFVGRYVDLTPSTSGAVGNCPFHDDQHPSLGVNAESNYWHCFAGCGGGSIIDFWMKWRECDFAAAIAELAIILLK